ncbi:N-formylglutamate amidohydrolase [Amaricoccus macauensis]|uniref:N-formylglutamate amidohydrolase n=1 Tax=Amaricoccus macauensis TaxID=57001 RepID=UPI003C7E7AD4
MENLVYTLSRPESPSSCAVFNSPHSGSDYPEAFLARTKLGPLQIRSSEDAFVNELFRDVPGFGAPLMAARVPRACVDLNRSADDLDPALIEGASRRFVSPRISAGLGVIPRVVAEGRAIMSGKLTQAEAQWLLTTYWYPYHDQLRTLIGETKKQFGRALLFDCHSMPNDALVSAPDVRGRRPDVILGDRFGVSCDRWVIESAADLFRANGFEVFRNAPFAGGYITQAYGRPRQGVHALQIEINRSLYMNEKAISKRSDFEVVAASIREVARGLVDLGSRPLRVAAE